MSGGPRHAFACLAGVYLCSEGHTEEQDLKTEADYPLDAHGMVVEALHVQQHVGLAHDEHLEELQPLSIFSSEAQIKNNETS